jgi:hypothetical protein
LSQVVYLRAERRDQDDGHMTAGKSAAADSAVTTP